MGGRRSICAQVFSGRTVRPGSNRPHSDTRRLLGNGVMAHFGYGYRQGGCVNRPVKTAVRLVAGRLPDRRAGV
jgi:hypothetical protein